MSKRDYFPAQMMEEIRKLMKDLVYYLNLPFSIVVKRDVEEGGYFIQVLELEGCMTQAETEAEIFPMIKDAMRLWLESSLFYSRTSTYRITLIPA